MGEAKLYVILGSHACRTGMLMLEHKGIPYETKMLPTGGQRTLARSRGGAGNRAGARDRRRESYQTNPAIARKLDEIQPEPPLFPSDPELRARVEQAESWSDDPFQMCCRRIGLAGSLDGPDGMVNSGRDGRLGMLLYKHDRSRYIGTRMVGRFIFNVNPETAAQLLADLPSQLDQIDAWIEAGVLNGEQLNAADYAIAANLALLTYRKDLVDEIERRPLGRLVDRILPAPAKSPAAGDRLDTHPGHWPPRPSAAKPTTAASCC